MTLVIASFTGFVRLVKQVRQFPRVPIDPQHQLGQVVAADGKAIEPLGKLVRPASTLEGISHIT